LAALAAGAPAQAHVTLAPSSVVAGQAAALTFRGPNERPTSATIEFAVQLPTDTPLAAVTVVPQPGWQTVVTMRGAVVDTITWRGGAIAPGSVGAFAIRTGPLPAVTHPLIFKAVQTYANGEVVRWIQERAPGEPEPPFPAPVLTVGIGR
jgi:uncharacterized protein YcnI